MKKSFSFEGCEAGDVISRRNGDLIQKATIIIPTEFGVIQNGTNDKQYICFQTYEKLKEEGWTFEEGEEERWKPKEKELYYFINDYGHGQGEMWKGSALDEMRFEFGNCFKTYELRDKKSIEIRKILKG